MPSTSKPVRFDYAGAKRAGFSDEDIARSLAAKRAAGINVFVDRAEVASIRAVGPSQTYDPNAPRTAQNNPAFANLGNLDYGPLDLLPTAGGFAGGLSGLALGAMAGGIGAIPGEIGGAAAGGAAGEGLRQYLKGERVNPGRIAVQGGIQGGAQALGIGTAKLAGMAAGKLAGLAGKARGVEAIAEQPASKMLDRFGNPVRPAVPGTPGIPPKGVHWTVGRISRVPVSVPVHPTVLDILANTLSRPAFQRFMRQSPKAAGSYLTSLFYAEPADATAHP